jgi:pimeloyl-ACP methyl ester carboxylesterase
MDTMRSFSYQGHEVFYRREGSGSPIVFLHNGGTSHRIWEPLLERYARDHDVIAMDMLGFGRSARPHVNYTLDLYVSQLAALLDELELEQVTLVGNCMGAATALTYAAQCPERTQTVIAVNVLTDHTIARGNLRPLLWITRRSRRTAAVLGWLGAHLRTPKLIAAASVRKMLLVEPERVSRELRDHLRDASRDPDQPRVMLNIIEHIGSFAGVEHNHVPVPVCVIWGADNGVLPAPDGAQFCSALHPDREVVVAQSGHLAMLERPAEVARAIDGFLAEQNQLGTGPPHAPTAASTA